MESVLTAKFALWVNTLSSTRSGSRRTVEKWYFTSVLKTS